MLLGLAIWVGVITSVGGSGYLGDSVATLAPPVSGTAVATPLFCATGPCDTIGAARDESTCPQTTSTDEVLQRAGIWFAARCP